MYPAEYLYSEEHEWLAIEDGICTVGITHFAQDELGEVVFVDLPEVGQVCESGDEIGSIESVKAVAEVFSPVSGEIVEVNEGLSDAPETVNEDPHGEGWLVRVKLSAEPEGLMTAEQYAEFAAGD
jgi:glycine cleavage system H protein